MTTQTELTITTNYDREIGWTGSVSGPEISGLPERTYITSALHRHLCAVISAHCGVASVNLQDSTYQGQIEWYA